MPKIDSGSQEAMGHETQGLSRAWILIAVEAPLFSRDGREEESAAAQAGAAGAGTTGLGGGASKD